MIKHLENKEQFNELIKDKVLVDFYAKLFHCDKKKFHVVYDSMSLSPKEEQRTIEHRIIGRPYVFFGGKAFRDVETCLKTQRFYGIYSNKMTNDT